MEEYKLIHDTGEITAEASFIDIPLSKPLKKLYALWKIVGNDNTTTSNMFCLVNGNIRWYTSGCSFQKNTTSGGIAILNEMVEGLYTGTVATAWNTAGYDREFRGNSQLINHTIENISRLYFSGGTFGEGSRIIIYGVEK